LEKGGIKGGGGGLCSRTLRSQGDGGGKRTANREAKGMQDGDNERPNAKNGEQGRGKNGAHTVMTFISGAAGEARQG